MQCITPRGRIAPGVVIKLTFELRASEVKAGATVGRLEMTEFEFGGAQRFTPLPLNRPCGALASVTRRRSGKKQGFQDFESTTLFVSSRFCSKNYWRFLILLTSSLDVR